MAKPQSRKTDKADVRADMARTVVMWYLSVRKPMSMKPMADVAFKKDMLRVPATEETPIDTAKAGE